jgi:hypothetical protein
MQIVKTVLTNGSKSETRSAVSAEAANILSTGTFTDLQRWSAERRKDRSSRTIDFDRSKKWAVSLDRNVQNHVGDAVKSIMRSVFTPSGCVTNAENGLIGVVTDCGYARHDVPLKGRDAAVVAKNSAAPIVIVEQDTLIKIYLHVKVALPNGTETTWKSASVRPTETEKVMETFFRRNA